MTNEGDGIKDNLDMSKKKKSVLIAAQNNAVILFTNPSARAGYGTRSIFKRSLTGF